MNRAVELFVWFIGFWCIYLCQGISNVNHERKNLLMGEETNEKLVESEVRDGDGKETLELKQKESRKRDTWPVPDRRHQQSSNAGYESGGNFGPEYSSYRGDHYVPPLRPRPYELPPNQERFGHEGYDKGHRDHDFGPEYIGDSDHEYGHHEYGHHLDHHDYGHHELPVFEAGHANGHGGLVSPHKGLALKKVLLPLAGLAILGAVAALSTSPVLLQLGTIGGRRRRRSATISQRQRYVYPINPKVKPEVKPF